MVAMVVAKGVSSSHRQQACSVAMTIVCVCVCVCVCVAMVAMVVAKQAAKGGEQVA